MGVRLPYIFSHSPPASLSLFHSPPYSSPSFSLTALLTLDPLLPFSTGCCTHPSPPSPPGLKLRFLAAYPSFSASLLRSVSACVGVHVLTGVNTGWNNGFPSLRVTPELLDKARTHAHVRWGRWKKAREKSPTHAHVLWGEGLHCPDTYLYIQVLLLMEFLSCLAHKQWGSE